MSNYFQLSPEFSSKKQITGFDCNSAILQEIDAIAEAIDWSRNKVIEESVSHIIHLIENLTYSSTPIFVSKFIGLPRFDRTVFGASEKSSDSKAHGIHRTAISLHPVILKKVDRISQSVGWSRTAFIISAMNHILSLIKDEAADPIPNVVKIARAVIPNANFAANKTDQSKA